MPPLQSDRDVTRLVTTSLAFRAVRAAMDRAAGVVRASRVYAVAARAVATVAGAPVATRARLAGVVLLTASAAHGAIMALVPRNTAPAVPYLAAAVGTVAACLCFAAARYSAGSRGDRRS